MPNISLERSLQEEARQRIHRICLRVRTNIQLFSQYLFKRLPFLSSVLLVKHNQAMGHLGLRTSRRLTSQFDSVMWDLRE